MVVRSWMKQNRNQEIVSSETHHDTGKQGCCFIYIRFGVEIYNLFVVIISPPNSYVNKAEAYIIHLLIYHLNIFLINL